MDKIIKIICVVGARPNFMKIAPLLRALGGYRQIESILVHTGQHYDEKMSKTFFDSLEITPPNYNLEVGSGGHSEQTARIMEAFEPILEKEKPDLILVVGDVNSTIACALVASKMHIKIAHIEAGARSFNKKMPEEINRVLTDHISDFLFAHSKQSYKNLLEEGLPKKSIFLVGNIMIDCLIMNLSKINNSKILENLNLKKDGFALMTMHRPANVDSQKNLEKIYSIISKIPAKTLIIFPIHPRTEKSIKDKGLWNKFECLGNLKIIAPQDYIDFMRLLQNCSFALTDSGGIQAEAAYFKIPTFTLRNETELLETIKCGANKLTGLDEKKILQNISKLQKGKIPVIKKIPFNDGLTAKRITKILVKSF